MFPITHIGPLTIQTSWLIILIGLWLGLSIAEKHSLKRGVEPDVVSNLVFITIIGGLVTARLAYVARYFSTFISDPASIILPNLLTLDASAGLVGGALAALIYANRKKLSFWQFADALTPLLAILAIGIHLAYFASGHAYGSPTNVPWAIDLWGARRHPVQLYELIGAGLTLSILWPSRQWITLLKPGSLFVIFLALSSLNLFIFEAFRDKSFLVLDHYRAIQIISLTALISCLLFLRDKLPAFSLSAPE